MRGIDGRRDERPSERRGKELEGQGEKGQEERSNGDLGKSNCN